MSRAAMVSTAAAAARVQDPSWLDSLVMFESGWNARAYNATSGATGLLQWIPRTMKAFGFLPADLAARIPSSGALSSSLKQEVRDAFLARYPTVEAQMAGPVKAYLAKYAPYPTEQSLYMAIFYPAFRSVSPSTAFPDSVRAQNPGIDTVADYVRKVKRIAVVKEAAPAMIGLSGAVMVGALSYFLLRSR